MRLVRARVKEYRSIVDSNEFSIGDITCLVGKNEAGKTAILKALYGLSPLVPRDGKFDITDDYPRREVEDYKQDIERGKRKPAKIVEAGFSLDEDEFSAIAKELGPDVVQSDLTLWKDYENERTFSLNVDEDKAIGHLLESAEISANLKNKLKKSLEASAILKILEVEEESSEITRLLQIFKKIEDMNLNGYIYDKYLKENVPLFLYFDEYYQMTGYENIQALQSRMENDALKSSDHPLLGLIKLARLGLDAILGTDRTQELKNKIEGAGNHLTKQIMKYWSQNKHIQMRFDVRPAQTNDPEGMRSGTNIWADIYDSRHMVTTGVGTRSRGFVWFFSFLSWYSQIRQENKNVILLLDEPGLSLHAKAQEDLLRYFESEVKGNNQLIYSTHSPFMVDPQNFDRVRIVQDKSIDSDEVLSSDDDGTKVLSGIFEASTDSLFPLQGALGYEIYQTLFVGPNSLVVEGVSDLIYIQTMSAVLESRGGEGLSRKWTITPVGGSDKVPTFVALLGNQKGLNIATLIDVSKGDRQKIENLYKKKLLQKNKVLTFADFTGTPEADIEDMFNVDLYVDLVNAEYKAELTKKLPKAGSKDQHPRVLVRIEKFLEEHPLRKGTFGHYRPARYFAENLESIQNSISQDTLDRFERAFKLLNNLV